MYQVNLEYTRLKGPSVLLAAQDLGQFTYFNKYNKMITLETKTIIDELMTQRAA